MSETSFTLTVRTEPGRGVIIVPEGTLSEHETLAVLFLWARLNVEARGEHWTAAALAKVAADVDAGSLYRGVMITETAS